MKDFIKSIDEIYKLITSSTDSIYKYENINMFKVKFSIPKNDNIYKFYYNNIKGNKEKGVIYTPKDISYYIVKNTISIEDIINNPFIKILDPACGCGNIILPCFLYLKKIFEDNLNDINKKNKIKLKKKDINKHIIYNNLYGYDIDEIAIKVLVIDLFLISGEVKTKNFLRKDFLTEDLFEKFDIYIGNPPYVGHKSVNKQYFKILKEEYGKIYKGKSDISYCFFIKAINNLKDKGKITFITSRYFLESISGKVLRNRLHNDSYVYKIIDFYGIRPFKGVGIDPTIIFLKGKGLKKSTLEVIKPKDNVKTKNKLFFNSCNNCNRFSINEKELQDEGWILIDERSKNIIKKIKSKCSNTLEDLCISHQGIITGCDKAFIVSGETIKTKSLETEIIKPWIKSSYIKGKCIRKNNIFIIYSNLIKDEKIYPNIIKHLSKYKNKLLKRRECVRGLRKWYELQWGRNNIIFDENKIVFPYKASTNKFYIDEENLYFSADIYSITIKDESIISYIDLSKILNSKLYNFYFKCFGKKLGMDLYEYYPNTVMRLMIPLGEKFNKDKDIYNYFGITSEEIKIIEQCI